MLTLHQLKFNLIPYLGKHTHKYLLRIFIVILLFLQQLSSFAQSSFNYPLLFSKASQVCEYVPQNWFVFSKVSSDFNNDTLPDYALVLQSADTLYDSSTLSTFCPRILLLLFQTKEHTYIKSIQSNSFFGKGSWGVQSSDPFSNMTTDKSRLKISFSTGGSTGAYLSYFFLYKDHTWILSRLDTELYEGLDSHTYLVHYYFLLGVQDDIIMHKRKPVKKLRSNIAETMNINKLENRVYLLNEIDASDFINPYLGDPKIMD